MLARDVQQQALAFDERAAALVALVRLVARVDLHVAQQVAAEGEAAAAARADEGPLAGVQHAVSCNTGSLLLQ